MLTAFVKGLVDTHSPRSPRTGCPVNGSTARTDRGLAGNGAEVLFDSSAESSAIPPAGVSAIAPAQRRAPVDECLGTVDPAEAVEFLEQYYAENSVFTPFDERLRQIRRQIDATGTYEQTPQELTFGARVAWRNSARCIGRLYWQGLRVRDRRGLSGPADIAAECVEHLRLTTRGGRIRPTITVFAPDRPGLPGPRIHNEQLIRYAGYRAGGGAVLGDPRTAEATEEVLALGWSPARPPGRFDVLPLMISGPTGPPELFELPEDAVLEVPLRHPDLEWFAELGLRWYAVPAISNMPLQVGGLCYSAAPFNGWYLGTEVGARNLADADRYDQLPVIAERMGLDTSSPRTLWKDRALLELMCAVQHSFDADGVAMADHHTESERFLTHVANESRAGRSCPAEWSWIVPPVAAATTAVFHRYYDEPQPDLRPAFLSPDTAVG